ncbi:aldehyde dehydrogenase [Mycoplana dimorpha]|uniref:Aldehyde dehydrogenase (NAD+) n=1 Tax=Mycoplana dimorpha TaxID=28320 RepID=A0A2T5BAW5_MYCDI|nr:aldehyde dehydrogenase [Mycoplana dimorpha]PTM96131.1 aldehyde dehydrogenase (NAD+) [Mycoplana dimorpha]
MLDVSSVEGSRQGLWIGGVMVKPSQDLYGQSYDPTTGQPWYEFARGNAADVAAAVAAAKDALASPSWRRTTQADRSQLLRRLADLIARDSERLALLETRDNGKLLKESRAQMRVLPETYHYYAGSAATFEGSTIPGNKLDMLNLTLREPIGVVGIIVPWNSPLYQLSWTLAPCLAMGNTVVIKPSEHTSVSTLALAQLIEEAGFPPGVVNVVTGLGSEAGAALACHKDVAKIAFTGSSTTGREIARAAAGNVAQTNLELGGKSPHCIFADADVDRAARAVLGGIFGAAGQSCVAGSRIFVQSAIYDDFVERLVALTASVRVGHPADDVDLGPLALKEQLEKVARYVGYGRQEGARLIAGGKQPQLAEQTGGWYFEPTLFADASNDMRIAQEEIFGPFGTIIRFEDERDLVALANDTPYGLAAGVWTQDIERAFRFARDVEAGTIWVNTYRSPSYATPMGGFKDSGYGKHYGIEALREYSRLKSVILDYSGNTYDTFVMRVR